jgi:Lipid A core - O-antigen ligase and related enzymes
MMRWLLVGYMWLYIHRPFEVWPWLGDFSVERVYMIVTLAACFMTGNISWPSNRLSWAFGAFFLISVASWLLSPYSVVGQKVVEDYAKVATFFILLTSVLRDRRDLRFIVAAFLVCMALYMVHSLREYGNGRYEWRMGTARMVGVDKTYSDPNTFAASIVYSLPMLLPWWLDAPTRRTRVLVLGYLGLAVTCILLTGSRTALAVTATLGTLGALGVARHKIRLALMLAVIAVTAWGLLPEDRRMRFQTILDPSVGPANAQVSAESRQVFFRQAVQVWQANPVFGVGPGAFGSYIGHGQQAHTLYGQLIAETGTLGVLAFLAIVGGIYLNYREAKRISKARDPAESRFPLYVCLAVALAVPLLLAMGFGGHNAYRYTWMWYGAFQIIALQVLHVPVPNPHPGNASESWLPPEVRWTGGSA